MAKTRTKVRPKAKGKAKKKPPASIEPSLIRGETTERRLGGRPSVLTAALIDDFLARLDTGLHLSNVAALCGIRAPQLADWLRDGRRDAVANRKTLAAQFSESVRKKLAEIQQRELGTLDGIQRIALGWLPTCQRCLKTNKPCGRHRRNLRLAADLTKWKLQHRFPNDWNRSTVQHELSVGDEPSPAPAPAAGDEGAPRPLLGLTIFVPARATL